MKYAGISSLAVTRSQWRSPFACADGYRCAARRGAAQDAAALGRVRHPTPQSAQDPRPRGREGCPHPHPLRLGLSRRRLAPNVGRPSRGLGSLTAGAPCPAKPRPFNPKPRNRKPQVPAPQRRRTEAAARSKSTDKRDVPRISRAKAMPIPGRHPKPAGNLLFAARAMRYRHPAHSGCAVVHRAHTPGGHPRNIGQNVYFW